jgi:putative ABC transport system permease protein
MIFRIVRGAFRARYRSLVLILLSVVMGTSIAASFLVVSQEVSSKVVRELRNYGANIVIEPKEGAVALNGETSKYLNEQDVPRVKDIFWRHNIVDVAPFLYGMVNVSSSTKEERVVLAGTWFTKTLSVSGEDKPFTTGIQSLAPWWQVEGKWVKDDGEPEVMAGAALAGRLGIKVGDTIRLDYQGKILSAKVTALMTTGGQEEEQIFSSLPVAQGVLGLPGKISRVQVSAITIPLDDFGRRDPKTMSQKEYEKWFCTSYVTSVAQQLEDVFSGSRAKPVWQIAEAEGMIVSKLQLLMLLLTVIALVTAAFGVATTMTTSVLERKHEIGLMKAMGADSFQISWLFLGEALVIGLIGGLLGYLAGTQLVKLIGTMVFNTPLQAKLILLPIAVASSLLITLAGSFFALRKALKMEATIVLRGGRV